MFDTPEAKAALKEQIDAAVAAATASTLETVTKLETNNKTLLSQLREAKKGAEIDPAKYAALEDQVTELSTQLQASTATVKKMETEHGKTVATLTKQLESENGFTQSLLVDNGLSDALVKAGVAPAFMPAVKAMLKSGVKVVADGETRKAVVGDKALADFVTGWAQSDEGKHYVVAPANSGGGGAGSGTGTGTSGKTIAADDRAAFGANLAEIAKGNQSAVKIA